MKNQEDKSDNSAIKGSDQKTDEKDTSKTVRDAKNSKKSEKSGLDTADNDQKVKEDKDDETTFKRKLKFFDSVAAIGIIAMVRRSAFCHDDRPVSVTCHRTPQLDFGPIDLIASLFSDVWKGIR